MSMSNLIVQQSTAHLMTDSGFFDHNGKIVCMGRKTILFPSQFLALSTTGSMSILHIGNNIRGDWHACSQEELISDIINATKMAYIQTGKDPIEKRSFCMIAGYSPQLGRAFGGYYFTSPKDAAESEVPWVAYTSGLITAPYVTPYDQLMPMVAEGFDVRTETLPLIQRQREFRGFEGLPGCGVAGAIDVTSIDKNGIQVQKIHEYPDQVGCFAGIPSIGEIQAVDSVSPTA